MLQEGLCLCTRITGNLTLPITSDSPRPTSFLHFHLRLNIRACALFLPHNLLLLPLLLSCDVALEALEVPDPARGVEEADDNDEPYHQENGTRPNDDRGGTSVRIF